MEEARFSPRPFLLLRTESPAVLSRPGMGNGVKEGVVRLREDAEPVLPAHVSSKASILPPPIGHSHPVPLLYSNPITNNPLTR